MAITSAEAKSKVEEIRQAQRRLREAIKQVRQKLQYAEEKGLLNSYFYFPTQGLRRDAMGVYSWPSTPYGSALRADLEKLQKALKDLGVEATRTKRAAAATAATEEATRATGEFDKELEKLLKDAEKDGVLDGPKIAQLQDESDQALDTWTQALSKSPSQKNIDGALGQLEKSTQLGLDMSSGKAAEAWKALKQAGDTRNLTAGKNFHRQPTVLNFRKLLDASRDSALLGGEGLNAHLKGFRRVRPGNTHRVEPGQTLSGISQHYYGSVSFWHVLYLNNYAIVGDDPNKLRPGIVLSIP